MSPPPPRLEEPYRSTAVPSGTARYLSWLFAAPEARAALQGVYALTSEWRALAEPASEAAIAHVKLGWWREELERAAAGRPVHPITRFLRALPGARAADFAALEVTLSALDRELTGEPLESPEALEAHARALRAPPLALAAALAGHPPESAAAALTALAVGQHLALALAEFRPAARRGRIVFALSELSASGVSAAALGAKVPPAPLALYLERVRTHARERLAAVEALLPRAEHAAQRHLLVLAALESRHLYASSSRGTRSGLSDLLAAWHAARRAARR